MSVVFCPALGMDPPALERYLLLGGPGVGEVGGLDLSTVGMDVCSGDGSRGLVWSSGERAGLTRWAPAGAGC